LRARAAHPQMDGLTIGSSQRRNAPLAGFDPSTERSETGERTSMAQITITSGFAGSRWHMVDRGGTSRHADSMSERLPDAEPVVEHDAPGSNPGVATRPHKGDKGGAYRFRSGHESTAFSSASGKVRDFAERRRLLIGGLSFVVVALGTGAAFLLLPVQAVALAAGPLLALAGGFLVSYAQAAEERGGVERAREEQAALLQDMGDVVGIPELPELLEFNERQMHVYQELSLTQARSSYRRSQFAFLVGLALVVGAVAVSFSDNTATRIAAGGVAALGGAFSAYLSATYLRVYERTLDQLNFYYRQPLVNSYLLTAERLADNMSGEKRQAAYDELLREVLACARTPEPEPAEPSVPRSAAPVRRSRKRRLRP